MYLQLLNYNSKLLIQFSVRAQHLLNWNNIVTKDFWEADRLAAEALDPRKNEILSVIYSLGKSVFPLSIRSQSIPYLVSGLLSSPS